MKFKVNLTTSGGSVRELEFEDCTSVQDAIDQANTTCKNCTINSVDLIPKAGWVRLYSDGDQIEIPDNSIYIPF